MKAYELFEPNRGGRNPLNSTRGRYPSARNRGRPGPIDRIITALFFIGLYLIAAVMFYHVAAI